MIPVLDDALPAVAPVLLDFASNGGSVTGALEVSRDFALDAAGQATGMGVISFDLSGLSQFGAPFGVGDIRQDGYPAGTLQSITVDLHGNVRLMFSNEQERVLGTLAIGLFSRGEQVLRSGSLAWRCAGQCAGTVIGQAGTQLLPQVQQSALNTGY